MPRFVFTLVATLVVTTLASGSAMAYAKGPGSGPMSEIQSAFARLQGLDSAGAADTLSAKDQQILDMVADLWNFDELTRRALGEHWASRSAAERREIAGLMRQLIESSSVDKLKEYSKQKVTYDTQSIQGPEATVGSTVHYKGEMIPVEYRMLENKGKWRIYDMVIDGVSMVDNYRRQFHQIITKESYSALVQKLKERLATKKSHGSAGGI